MKASKILIIIVLSFLLNSCAIFRVIFVGKRPSPKPRKEFKIPPRAERKSNVQKSPTEILTPEEKSKLALSDYNTARAYEIKYYEKLNINDARIAIERFESYYQLSPNGEYAALAILRKIELLTEINDHQTARNELNRLLRRYDLIQSYKDEIEDIKGKIRD